MQRVLLIGLGDGAGLLALHGQLDILYQFGHQLIDEQQLQIDRQGIRVPGFAQPIRYAPCRYADLRETR